MSDHFPFWSGVALIGVLLLVVAGLLAYGARLLWRRRRIPKLIRTLRQLTPWIVTDLLLPDGLDSKIPMDCLVLTGQKLHVVQMFRIEGSVFGSANMNEWTVLGRAGRWTFPNPLLSGPLRSLAIQESLVERIPVQVDYVFWGDCRFPKGKADGVHEMAEYLESMRREIGQFGEPPATWQNAWESLKEGRARTVTATRRHTR
jgi:hypothetical protein